MRHTLRTVVLLAALILPSLVDAQRTRARNARNYVIVHGAWGGGWDWKRVDSVLTSRGHHVYRMSLTGLGERVHLASRDIGLGTHIDDVVNSIRFEDLNNVILIGHSYGGMVITGVADRIPDRLRHVVYVDAFVPDSGESVQSLAGDRFGDMLTAAQATGMLVPSWVPADAKPPYDVPHPLKTFLDTLSLSAPAGKRVRSSYILTMDKGATTDAFSPYAVRATTRGWRVDTLITDHTPERSAIPALTRLFLRVP
jgi:pimeloyl-ACP methyl ester carboxylesterase